MDEHGTEAAAATAMVARDISENFEPPQPAPFVVDRPFFFFIHDDRSGAVLFMGRVMDPRGWQSPKGGLIFPIVRNCQTPGAAPARPGVSNGYASSMSAADQLP